jgi:tetratricopeptide (TPR) repeat protein
MRINLFIAFFLMGLILLSGCNPGEKSRKEGPVIVYITEDGRTLTLEDLKGVNGTIQYEIVGAADVPAEAKDLHQRAREAGARGEYESAIDLLTKASELAPQWPYPIYDRAYTYLLMKDYDAARIDYQKTVELAPRGFFTAITALDTLTREKKGEFPQGLYLAYLSLEWQTDPVKKLAMVRQLVDRYPQFSPGWKELTNLLDNDQDRLASIEKGLATEPDSETRGILLINKALILDRHGKHDEAVKLLGQLALDPKSTLGTEQIAKATLAIILKP